MAERNEQADIAIVGGGPVGLATACCLADIGLSVILVDGTDLPENRENSENLANSAGIPDFDARVSALTVASQQLLASVGAWDTMAGIRLCPFTDMRVWDGEGTGSIHFSAADVQAPALGHIVENRVICAALDQQARARQSLDILRPETVSAVSRGPHAHDGVALSLTGGGTISARLLIGADGSNSLIRRDSGFATREWDYQHQAIVATVRTACSHQYTAWQRFMVSGPLAFLPLALPGLDEAQQNWSSIVWSCVTDKAERLMSLDDADFSLALAEGFEFRLGAVEAVSARFSFPLWQKHATDYVSDRIALVGDAAHTIHPLAGQGVNLGFADVAALTDVIRSAHGKGEDFASHQVLSRYQRRRKGVNLGMMAAMEGFKRLFGNDDPVLVWLRNSGLSLVDKTGLIKHQIMQQAMGL